MNTTLAPSADRSNSPQLAGSGAFLAAGVLAVTPDGATKSPGTLYGGSFLAGATLGFVQIHDKSAAMAPGDVPMVPSIPIAANGYASFDFGVFGLGFVNGCKIALSSTAASYTAVAGADTQAHARFMSSPGAK